MVRWAGCEGNVERASSSGGILVWLWVMSASFSSLQIRKRVQDSGYGSGLGLFLYGRERGYLGWNGNTVAMAISIVEYPAGMPAQTDRKQRGIAA